MRGRLSYKEERQLVNNKSTHTAVQNKNIHPNDVFENSCVRIKTIVSVSDMMQLNTLKTVN